MHTETKRAAKEKINRNTHNIDKPHARVEHVLTERALGHRQIEANRKRKPGERVSLKKKKKIYIN